MEYVRLNNHVKMPLLGLGTWNLRGQECIDTVAAAIQNGYRLIDTAQMYDNEKEVGQGIIQSGIPRNELFITTKIYGKSNSYQKAKAAIEQSLQNLQTDYIDLMLLHEPYPQEDEMYKALQEAYDDGKVKAIGISNYDENRFKKFVGKCSIIPAVNQVECHVYYQKYHLQNLLEDHGTLMQAWSPLAQAKENIGQNAVLLEIGKKYQKTAAQVALRFLTQRGISVIPKSRRKERLIENISIFDFKLTSEDMKRINDLDRDDTLFLWTKYL